MLSRPAGHLPHAAGQSDCVLRPSQDMDDRGTDAESGLGAAAAGEASVSFSGLYNSLGRRLVNERSVLLLYLLLHGCQTFQVGRCREGTRPGRRR